jgi:ribonuclease HI
LSCVGKGLWKLAKLSVMEGEGVALLEAIKLVVHKEYNYVEFESDSQSIVNAIYASRVGIAELYYH